MSGAGRELVALRDVIGQAPSHLVRWHPCLTNGGSPILVEPVGGGEEEKELIRLCLERRRQTAALQEEGLFAQSRLCVVKFLHHTHDSSPTNAMHEMEKEERDQTV